MVTYYIILYIYVEGASLCTQSITKSITSNEYFPVVAPQFNTGASLCSPATRSFATLRWVGISSLTLWWDLAALRSPLCRGWTVEATKEVSLKNKTKKLRLVQFRPMCASVCGTLVLLMVQSHKRPKSALILTQLAEQATLKGTQLLLHHHTGSWQIPAAWCPSVWSFLWQRSKDQHVNTSEGGMQWYESVNMVTITGLYYFSQVLVLKKLNKIKAGGGVGWCLLLCF